MNKWKTCVLASAVSAALLGAGAANAATVKVAVAGPVTGPVAQYGDMQFAGAGIAQDLLDGETKLEVVVYDDACEPKQAVAVANKIINDGIQYVIGHLCSGATQPASDVYEDEGVLMITPAATSPDITARGHELVFRTIGLDSDQGPTAARYILTSVKPSKVAVIHDKQQYGEGIATSVKQELEAAGTEVVAFEGVTAGDKDFSALIAKLKRLNVDFVYYGGYHPELGLLLRQSYEQGLEARYMGPEGVGNKDISAIAQEASEGLLVTLPKKYDLVPANAPIVDALKAKGEDPTGPFVWTAYAAMQAIQAGVTAAGDDPEAVAEYLRANTVDTVMGPLQWDDKGDLKGFDFGVFSWHADGTSSVAE
ncbi:branched-chain amino acid ABC transporter substrate-binding protein [Aliagarivorans taiwanensis]|uniref:branched-chain amino acid ABC transporter substrate-binding protein n=1 Tax=Aliagarivorans taiwanensis TaxID=561966 RepID=UPI000400495C|nr:branched-chain amino acid ABC transporter substrate-binding protein [Aliagarivorans taiwanensis]